MLKIRPALTTDFPAIWSIFQPIVSTACCAWPGPGAGLPCEPRSQSCTASALKPATGAKRDELKGAVVLAPPSAIAAHLWVALKHEITFLKPTFLQDNVVAEVIAEKVQGARAMFRTVLKRGEDVLSEIQSSWCCLDAATQRPARLAREVIGRFVSPDA